MACMARELLICLRNSGRIKILTMIVSRTIEITHATPDPEENPSRTRKSWIFTHTHATATAKG